MKKMFDFKALRLKNDQLNFLKEKLNNQEIEAYIVQKKFDKTHLLAFLDNNIIIFEIDSQSNHSYKTYDYKDLTQIKKINSDGFRKCDLLIEFLNSNLHVFDFQNIETIDFIINFFNKKKKIISDNVFQIQNKLLDDLDKNKINLVKKEEIYKNNKPSIYDENKVYLDLKNNLSHKENLKNNSEINKSISANDYLMIDDNNISDKSTFSSLYLSNLLSKKNVLLPNNSLTLIEKLQNKLDLIQISLSNEKTIEIVDSNISIANQISELETKIKKIDLNNLSKNDDELEMKLNNSIDLKTNNFNFKLDKFEKILNDKVDKSYLSDEINTLKIDLNSELNKRLNQNDINLKIQKMESELLNSKEKILVIQKSWDKYKDVVNENLVTISESYINKSNQKMDISELVNKISFKEMFEKCLFGTSNKILAIDKEGQGAYFNIDNFKDNIIEIVKNSEIKIHENIENKISRIQSISEKIYDYTSERFEVIKKYYNEIKDQKNNIESFNAEKINSNNQKIYIFKAVSYILNGVVRYGIRSGMKWCIKDKDSKKGVNSLYLLDNKFPLELNNYDGIIFRNVKYYFNIQNEFEDKEQQLCQIQITDYNDDLKINVILRLLISKENLVYSVVDENKNEIDDSNPLSYLYDLKWITLFKD
ncbi:MAG: hypothetical protein ACRDCG_02090 [Mycoplasmoidaceae bacterium]